VQEGAPPLASLRPDLPRALTATVDRMLDPDPARRPSAKEASARLRVAWSEVGERPRAVTSRTRLGERATHAGLSALFAGVAAWLLPFFPAGWPLLLGALVGMAALLSPTAGLALALAIPVLPIGNASLGLALVYSVLAALWLALFWRDPRSSFLFLLGPTLAPFHALPLVTVAFPDARGLLRRGAIAAAAALAAATVAGIRTGESLGLNATSSPREAFTALTDYLTANPEVWIGAVVLTAATVAAPFARSRGLWGIAAWGSAFLAAALIAPGSAVSAFPLVLWVWIAAAMLALPLLRPR
jgi:hypothetical protein